MPANKWRGPARKRTMRPIPPEIQDVLYYDQDAGECYWKRSHTSPTVRNVQAGFLMPNGYISIGFKGRNYYAHRIAWFLQTGDDPALPIDHADGDKHNNRWSNLRLATDSENAANRPGRSNRLKGAHKSGTRFYASVKRGDDTIRLGPFDTQEEAHAAYMSKAIELFGEFARAA